MPVEQDGLERQWEPLFSPSVTGGDVRGWGDAGDAGAPAPGAWGGFSCRQVPSHDPQSARAEERQQGSWGCRGSQLQEREVYVMELAEWDGLAGAGMQWGRHSWACHDGEESGGIELSSQKTPNLSCHQDKIMNVWKPGSVKQACSGKFVTSCLLLTPTGIKSVLSWGMVDLSMYLGVSWLRGSGWRWLVRVAASCGHGFSSHGCGCRGAELSLLRVSSEFWYIIASNSHPGSRKLNRGLVYFTLLIFSPEGKQPGLGFSLVVAWANDAKEQGLVFAVMVSGYYSLTSNVNEVP